MINGQQGHSKEITASQNAVSLTPDILKILEETREGAMEELDNIGNYVIDDEERKKIVIGAIAQMAMNSENSEMHSIGTRLKIEGDIKYIDIMGRNILMYAAKCSEYIIINTILDKFPELINEQDFEGKTALMYAIENDEENKKAVVKLLIGKGADVNIIDKKFKWTALHYAAEKTDMDIYNILLMAGADCTKENDSSWTAKDILENYGIK